MFCGGFIDAAQSPFIFLSGTTFITFILSDAEVKEIFLKQLNATTLLVIIHLDSNNNADLHLIFHEEEMCLLQAVGVCVES